MPKLPQKSQFFFEVLALFEVLYEVLFFHCQRNFPLQKERRHRITFAAATHCHHLRRRAAATTDATVGALAPSHPPWVSTPLPLPPLLPSSSFLPDGHPFRHRCSNYFWLIVDCIWWGLYLVPLTLNSFSRLNVVYPRKNQKISHRASVRLTISC